MRLEVEAGVEEGGRGIKGEGDWWDWMMPTSDLDGDKAGFLGAEAFDLEIVDVLDVLPIASVKAELVVTLVKLLLDKPGIRLVCAKATRNTERRI